MKIEKKIINNETFYVDGNNNRAYLSYFGSEEKCIEALESLNDCSHCINCYCCSDCSYCINCYRCSDCINCIDCLNCTNCSDCSYCINCYRCSDCINCIDCSYCINCYRCSDCINCYRCSDCINCSYCSYCSGYSKDKKVNIEIPIIKNIHQKLFSCITKEENHLDMRDWHTCKTTHCRAGWVVHLAGSKGYALEEETSTAFAAMAIYKKSSLIVPTFNDFYVMNNDKSLKNIEECALYEYVLGKDSEV